jgi:hypothetical protein
MLKSSEAPKLFALELESSKAVKWLNGTFFTILKGGFRAFKKKP